MLTGTADIHTLASRAPTLPTLDGEPVALRDVDVLYAVYEIGHEGREALLPPALHPTEPPHATFTFIRAADTEFGPAERCAPRLDSFAAAAWGGPLVRPVYPVSASVARADLTIPRLRFVCRPDVMAFEGTEPIKRPPPA